MIFMLTKNSLRSGLSRTSDIFSRRLFFPLCFVFSDLYKLVLFYLGFAYRENPAYSLIYLAGCALFALICGLVFLSVLKRERPAAVTLALPVGALLFFAIAFLWGFMRGALESGPAYSLCLFILRCLPALFAGVTLALLGGEDGFSGTFESLGFIALPAALIYLVCALFDCSIYFRFF